MPARNATMYMLMTMLVLLWGCEDTELPASFDTLPAHWIIENSSDSVYLFAKVANPPTDNYCITFKKTNKLIEQKNAGFCGTPPITFANFDGEWSLSADSILSIKVDFWGGYANYKWKIIRLTTHKLSVTKQSETYTFKNN